MNHTIICWDCSYRNFFHTIDGLLNQDYDREKFEVIYVEQRSRKFADDFNHRLGLKSLWDRYEEVRNLIDIKVIYLDDPSKVPYHLGKTVNKGLNLATGRIVSVMDGDMLMPSDFLKKLELYHEEQGDAVVNLVRHMASRPVGVDKDNWTKAEINFESCLQECPDRGNAIPRKVINKGPMISARLSYWQEVEGYDEHFIWSTGLTRLGQDVTTRLELLVGVSSVALPNSFAVHPWHPEGLRRFTFESQKMLSLHNQLIRWAKSKNVHSRLARKKYTDKLYNQNKQFVDSMIAGERSKIIALLPSAIDALLGKTISKIDRLRGGY